MNLLNLTSVECVIYGYLRATYIDYEFFMAQDLPYSLRGLPDDWDKRRVLHGLVNAGFLVSSNKGFYLGELTRPSPK